MPITSQIKVGDRVFYQDVANPRADGVVVEVLPDSQYRVVFDDSQYDSEAVDAVTVSDLRQYGWNRR